MLYTKFHLFVGWDPPTRIQRRWLVYCLSIFPGPGPFPALLDLWGGGGGLVEYRSALLASRGFLSLALEYLTIKTADSSSRNVGNAYFEV